MLVPYALIMQEAWLGQYLEVLFVSSARSRLVCVCVCRGGVRLECVCVCVCVCVCWAGGGSSLQVSICWSGPVCPAAGPNDTGLLNGGGGGGGVKGAVGDWLSY